MLRNQDVNYSLICAVREGRLGRARELINSFGLSYSQAWSEGYVLLCDALKNEHTAVAKLLLTSGSKVNRKKNNLPSNTPLHFAVVNGDIEIVKMILDKGGKINAKNQFGRTPLHNAIEVKKMEVTELLLKNGADVDARDSDGTSLLHIAVEIGCLQIVEQLLKYGAYANYMCTSTWKKGYTPLHIAVEKGSKEVITLLLSRGANVDIKGEDNITPLHIAAKKGYIHIVEDLLKHGACIHSFTLKELYTPLHFASELGNEEAVKLLLNKGADINASTNGDLTPLHIATKTGRKIVVKLLLQHGAKVDNQDKDGKTTLHLAVEKGYLTIVEDVLRYCPDINDQSNRSSLKIAVQGNGEEYKKIVETLLEYGLIVNPEDANNLKLLHAAVEKGYLKIVKDLLKYGADVNTLCNSTFQEGFTPLHSAAKNKQVEVAKLLISYEADINAQDKTGKTPIFYAIESADLKVTKLLLSNKANIKDSPDLLNIAVKKACIEIVEALLQHDADINASDKYGMTALHFTVLSEKGFSGFRTNKDPDINIKGDIAKLLLSKGANVDVQTKKGVTTLHAAIEKGYLKIIEDLLKYGADVNALCNSTFQEGFTLLHSAAKNKQVEVAKLLISYEADINAQDKTGKTPIFYAIENADLKVTKLLLTNKANIKDSPDLLNIAVKKACIEIVEALLQHDADINASDIYGRTALHFTVLSDNERFFGFRTNEDSDINIKGEIAKLLLSKGANVDAQTKKGVTTLHAAIEEGYVKVVEALLKYNANVNSGVKSNITPLHLSAQRGNEEISMMLLNKGANVNAKQKDGITALHIASQEGHKEVVVTLLEYGSDINITCRNNHTPLDYAIAGIRSFYSRVNNYISDDDDFYDSDRGVSSCEVTAVALNRHIIKMKTANLYVSEKNLSSSFSISDFAYEFETELSYFQDDCDEEITRMKSEKINNPNISFYDILAKGTSSLAIYMRNENIVQVLKSDDYKTKFPIYASMIKSQFRKGMERKELQEQGNKIFSFLFNNFPELPYDCIEKIFSYLSNEDLRILMDVCKPLSIRHQ